eukprot:2533788-Rhodomonas_salina.1
MCGEQESQEALCEHIRYVVRSHALDQGHDVVPYEIQYEIASDVNVPCKFSIDEIVRNLDASHIVLPDHSRFGLLVPKSLQHCPEVDDLLSSHAGGDVLCRAQSDAILVFGLPGYRCFVQREHVSCD